MAITPMRLWLRFVVTGGALVVYALSFALSTQSHHTAGRLHGRLWGEKSFLLGAKEGRIVAIVFDSHAPGWWQWETHRYPVEDELSFPLGHVAQYESWAGFGWISRPGYFLMRPTQTLPNGRQITFFGAATASLNGGGPIFPIWVVSILSGAAAVLPWIGLRNQFSLRTLFVLVTLAAIGLGLIVYSVR
jgi:hypothetical protein